MKGPNVFQIVLTGIFGLFILGGVLFFVLFRGSSPLQSAGTVTIWGTIPSEKLGSAFEEVRKQQSGLASVTYEKKDPATYEDEVLKALAAGKGPDLILLTQDQIISNKDRIVTIPYTSLSERKFRDTFLDAANVLLFPDGVMGIPFSFDPIVMYWNKDMFATAGLVNPPKYWDEILTMVPKLTRVDNSQNILQSGLAFGASSNIAHFKDILSLLILQAGSPVVSMDEQGRLSSAMTVNTEGGSNQNPGEAALRFFTEFSNPIKTVYSWNRALPEARQAFVAGDLAIYLGYASEYPELRRENPNLNFDLATVPQSRNAKRRTSFGELTSFAIPKLAKNQRGAFIAASLLSQANSVKTFTAATKLPPVRRDILAEPQSDAYRSVLFDSAVIAREWLDPSPDASKVLFTRMVDDVTFGKRDALTAVREANEALGNLFK